MFGTRKNKELPMAIFRFLSAFARRIMRVWGGRYRPERHYMRGAGPASKRSARQSVGS
jgi:hypothetical protein